MTDIEKLIAEVPVVGGEKRPSQEQLDAILEAHRVQGVPIKLKRWDLSRLNFNRVSFWMANLRDVSFDNSKLHYVSFDSMFRGADLHRVSFCKADLHRVRFCKAALVGVDFRRTKLHYVDFGDAKLHDVSFDETELRNVIFREAVGNGREIKNIDVPGYKVTYTSKMMWIGCEGHPIAEWEQMSDERISEMDTGVLPWWREHKARVFNHIQKDPAVPFAKEEP